MRVLPQTSRGDADLSNLSQVSLEMRPQKSTDQTADPSASRPILPPFQDARMFASGLVLPHCLQAAARQLWAVKVR
jgi:hypothetical protein